MSTTQGDHQQGPNPAPSEHPLDHDARSNEHRAPTLEAAKQKADTSASDSAPPVGGSSGAEHYPPQKHAGKAGLGPHYYEQHRATFQDKIHGLVEELEGRIQHDENLWQHGHDRVTGELKRKEREKVSPFHKENEDQKATEKAIHEQKDKGHAPKENKA